MNILAILSYIEDEVTNAQSSPFSNRATIDKEKCLNLLSDIRQNLPDELLEAERIVKEKNQILYDAEKETEAIIQDAERKAEALVNEDTITKAAYQKADEIIARAQTNSQEMRQSANRYVEDILSETAGYIERQLELVKQNLEQMRGK